MVPNLVRASTSERSGMIRQEYDKLWQQAKGLETEVLRHPDQSSEIPYISRLKVQAMKFEYIRGVLEDLEQNKNINIIQTADSLAYLYGDLKGLEFTVQDLNTEVVKK
jgi:hypothetical protein